jgi:hypothetical protein
LSAKVLTQLALKQGSIPFCWSVVTPRLKIVWRKCI